MPHSRHDSLDLETIVRGIERWVEIESPTGEVTAVNRMIDRVAADLADGPVRIERLPGRSGFADTLVARTHGDGHGILVLPTSIPCIRSARSPLRLAAAMATGSTGRASTT